MTGRSKFRAGGKRSHAFNYITHLKSSAQTQSHRSQMMGVVFSSDTYLASSEPLTQSHSP